MSKSLADQMLKNLAKQKRERKQKTDSLFASGQDKKGKGKKPVTYDNYTINMRKEEEQKILRLFRNINDDDRTVKKSTKIREHFRDFLSTDIHHSTQKFIQQDMTSLTPNQIVSFISEYLERYDSTDKIEDELFEIKGKLGEDISGTEKTNLIKRFQVLQNKKYIRAEDLYKIFIDRKDVSKKLQSEQIRMQEEDQKYSEQLHSDKVKKLKERLEELRKTEEQDVDAFKSVVGGTEKDIVGDIDYEGEEDKEIVSKVVRPDKLGILPTGPIDIDKRTGRKTILLDKDGQAHDIAPYSYKYNKLISKCEVEQRSAKWIGKNVKAIRLGLVEASQNPDQYVIMTDYVDYDDIRWYRARRNFLELQCNSRRMDRKQDGLILTLFTDDGQPVQFVVAYVTDNGEFIIQDEKLFKHEVQYVRHNNLTVDRRIQLLLKERMLDNSLVRRVGLDIIKDNLVGSEFNVSDYSKDVEDNIYEMSKDGIVNDYFKRVASIFVFFTPSINKTFGRTDKKGENMQNIIFIQRLKEGYYLPEVLPSLGLDDKMPEVLDSPGYSVKDKQRLVNIIVHNIDKLVQRYGYFLYISLQPGHKMTRPQLMEIIHLEAPTLYEQDCVNSDDVLFLGDTDYIKYIEDNKTYCIDIISILERFQQGDYTNPYTGIMFTKDIIDKVRMFADPHNVKNKYRDNSDSEMFQDVDGVELAPGLIDLIKNDIKRLGQDEYKDDDTDEYKDDTDEYKEYDTDEDKDKDKDEDKEEDTDTDTDYNKDREDDFELSEDEVDDDKFEELGAEIEEIMGGKGEAEGVEDIDEYLKREKGGNRELLCHYCNEAVKDRGQYKTTIYTEDGKFDIIRFCDLKCFEKHDEWKKPKKE